MTTPVLLGLMLTLWAFITNKKENVVFVPGNDNGNDIPAIEELQNRNVQAFLSVIQYAEGTYSQNNPYAVTYGYSHVISNFSDHPTNTGEWNGEVLPDSFCINVGLSPGCRSTAAGAYQFLQPTWNEVKNVLQLQNFSSESQDIAAKYRINLRGGLEMVKNGQFTDAIFKVNREWASLPGSPYGQPTKSMNELKSFYESQGGLYNYQMPIA